MMHREFNFHTPHGPLHGHLLMPQPAQGLILLAQLRPTPLDMAINANLGSRHWAILSMGMLTPQEEHYPDTMHNVPLLTQRLLDALDMLRRDGDTEELPIGLFASAHVAPAAVRAAARRDQQVRALACHGGLIDLAGLQHLDLLVAPLLMLVDPDDTVSAASFQRATAHLKAPHELHCLEPGENPAGRIAGWFGAYLQAV